MAKHRSEIERAAGVEAGSQVRRETLDACKRHRITVGYVVGNLKRLSKYRGRKPFHKDGNIVYSKPLDDTSVQLGATKELAELMEMYPAEKHEHELSGSIGTTVNLSEEDRKLLKGALNDIAKELVKKAHEHD
jgi:hypothetical protein